MYTKEEALVKITELVEKFSDQLPAYKKSDYNETLTRKDFIDPFFEALGWDINNRSGAWEAYREVIHEDKLKIGGVTTAPDYSFRLTGGQRLFFVEAKKPSIVIKDDVAPAYQVRLYGWNAKLALSVVTDFEEFAIYDCSKKPLKTDKASKARLNYFTYKDYITEFDFFWNTFSKQQVIKGGLVKFQQSDKKGTATVDKAFLENLDEWRKVLATNINKNTPGIGEDDLNYAVQQLIDRIIFLRIAEDRALEPYGQLKTSLQNENHYQELYRQFRVADDKYNSGLFHFKKEKENAETPDSISGKLSVDNKVIKSIINSIYPPASDFRFNYLPVEILGSAYEQFLGKQIIIKGSRATIEDKPEVRKAGGVYYTPQYIVEYIVEQTLGKLCADKTPKEVSRIKIVDPACGSGSFLLGAYQYLLKWHMDYYTNNAKALKQKEAVLTPEGNLTTAEKKRILLNNLYGVDIDRNAVEVTKLSLLLKCMEGETTASINTQMTFFHERVLPSLEKNIKCGNSLIDLDYYDTEFDFGEKKKIRPFNWQQQFPEVYKQGGFDVVVGNPPYVRIQTLKDLTPESIIYYKKTFDTAKYGNYDLYVLFVEKGLTLLNAKGKLGFILPNKFFNTDYGIGIRELLTDGRNLNKVIDFGSEQVFESATTYCCLLILNKSKADRFQYIKTTPMLLKDRFSFIDYKTEKFSKDAWIFRNEADLTLTVKIYTKSINLIDVPCEISRGSSTGNDKIFVVHEIGNGIYKNGYGEDVILEKEILKKPIYATDFSRYLFRNNSKYFIIYPYQVTNDVKIIEEENLKIKYPLTFKYLKSKKIILEQRAQFQKWYLYSAPRSLLLHSKADIIIPLLADKGLFTTLPNNKDEYTLMAGGGFSVTVLNSNINKNYILGLLNSKLLYWVLQSLSNVFRGGWITCTKQYFSNLPIKKMENTNDMKLYNEIINSVETVTKLNIEKLSTSHPNTLEQLNHRIAYTDEKINKLVYELYGLSEEEIGIVEGR